MSNKKTTGIIRRIDELGRIVVPKEIRRTIGLREGDFVEISLSDGIISVQKPEFSCPFCNKTLTEEENNSNFKICSNCIDSIKAL